MNTEMNMAAELGAAATEMKQAAALVSGMKTQIEALTQRCETLEQGQTKGAENVDKLSAAMSGIEKKCKCSNRQRRKPSAFKQPHGLFLTDSLFFPGKLC